MNNISLAVVVLAMTWILSKLLGVSLRGPIRLVGGLIALAFSIFANTIATGIALIAVLILAAVIWVITAIIRRLLSAGRPRDWGRSQYYGGGYYDGGGRWHNYR